MLCFALNSYFIINVSVAILAGKDILIGRQAWKQIGRKAIKWGGVNWLPSWTK